MLAEVPSSSILQSLCLTLAGELFKAMGLLRVASKCTLNAPYFLAPLEAWLPALPQLS